MRTRNCPQCDERRARTKSTPRSAPSCEKCGRKMKRGIALETTFGRRDGRPITEGSTLNPVRGGRLVPAWKCPECGRSIKR